MNENVCERCGLFKGGFCKCDAKTPEVDPNVVVHPTAVSKPYAVAKEALDFVKAQPSIGIISFVLVPTASGKPAVMPFMSDIGLHEMALLNALMNTMTNNQVKNSFAKFSTVELPPDESA